MGGGAAQADVRYEDCYISTLRVTRQPDVWAEPELDPELAQNGVEFASRVLSRSPATVLGLQPVDAAEFLFMFAIRVLDGKEPLPKGAAAEFWVCSNPSLLATADKLRLPVF